LRFPFRDASATRARKPRSFENAGWRDKQMLWQATLEGIVGVKDHVGVGQECARAILIFFYGLLVLRFSGRRTFGKWSALDIIVSIIVGSSLSRALTGSASLPGTLAAVAVLVILHVGLSYLVARSESVSRLVEGDAVPLVKNGKLDEQARLRHMISKTDIAEALAAHQLDGLEQIEKVKALKLEPNGKLNVIKAQA
jgi:uncharacterized membrane protein YcaP (DUF421 family)